MLDVPVVILGGGTNGLSWVRSLGRRGVRVIVADNDPVCIARFSNYASEFFHCPSVRERPDDFVEALLSQSDRWGRAILVPTADQSLEILSQNRERLRERFIVPVPPWPCTDVFIHKQQCHVVAQRLGLSLPHTLTVTDETTLDGNLSGMSYPCLVKPVAVHEFGHIFHTKMFRADSAEDVRRYVKLAAQRSVKMIVQEIIPGGADQLHEYVAYYDDESNPVMEFTWQKLRQCPPIYGVGRVGQSTCNPEIVPLARKILQHVGFVGMCEVEFKLDPRDGCYKFIEINGRSTLQLQLPIDSGMDFPWIMYRHLTGELRSGELSARYRTGIRWIELLSELEVLFRYPGRERLSLRERLRPYCGPVSWAVWDRKDPRPFAAGLAALFRGVLRMLERHLGSEAAVD